MPKAESLYTTLVMPIAAIGSYASDRGETRAPGRRALFGTGVAALFASAVASVPKAIASDTTEDPVIAICRAYWEADAACVLASDKHGEIRARLVSRYGEPTGRRPTAADLWAHDPEYGDLVRLGEESDAHDLMCCQLTERLAEAPATSVAGVLAKMQLAISLFPAPNRSAGFYEDFALTVLDNGARVLGEQAETRA